MTVLSLLLETVICCLFSKKSAKLFCYLLYGVGTHIQLIGDALTVNVGGEWHMATFFYESVWDFIGFWVLWLNRKKTTASGNLFLLYLVWYGLGRAFIEGLRTDSLMLGPLRVSQVLSVLLCIGAATALWIRNKKTYLERA